jgi:hypothetical protein
VRIAIVLAVATASAFAAQVRAAPPLPTKPPKGCPHVRAHRGKADPTGDWEAVFGWHRKAPRSLDLLKRVRSKGFSCAVIEREAYGHVGGYEVAIIGLHTREAGEEIARRAFRKGLYVRTTQS